MKGIWVRVVKRNRIVKQDTRECSFDEAKETLREVLRGMDVPYPIWMDKHDREFDRFRTTRFTSDHFVEFTDFDRLEIEYMEENARHSDDPRNA